MSDRTVRIQIRMTANLEGGEGEVRRGVSLPDSARRRRMVISSCPRTRTEEEWTLGLLRDANVYVQPGFFYDFESEAFLIVSLLTEPTTFRAGIERISAYLDAQRTSSSPG